jgi:large subunit ribosomal protein L14
MIQLQTLLRVYDNSGAKTAKCIKVLKGSFTRKAYIGDLVVVAVQQTRKNLKKTKSKIRRGDVFLGLIIQTKKKTYRKDGHFINFSNNAVVLLNKQKKPVASRVLGPVAKEIRTQQFMKVGMLASGIL